jgi:hypothetical protein
VRPALQAIGGEGEHVERGPVDPLGVVDDSHQAPAGLTAPGQQVQQAKQGAAGQVTAGHDGRIGHADSGQQLRSMRSGQGPELSQDGTQQLPQPRERKPGLALPPDGGQHPQPAGTSMCGEVRQHGALADAGLAQHNQRPVGAFARGTGQRPHPADLGRPAHQRLPAHGQAAISRGRHNPSLSWGWQATKHGEGGAIGSLRPRNGTARTINSWCVRYM